MKFKVCFFGLVIMMAITLSMARQNQGIADRYHPQQTVTQDDGTNEVEWGMGVISLATSSTDGNIAIRVVDGGYAVCYSILDNPIYRLDGHKIRASQFFTHMGEHHYIRIAYDVEVVHGVASRVLRMIDILSMT